METTHTPGPWIFYADLPSTEPNWHIVTTANKMRVLANVHIEPGNAMDLANAHLISASPDLLAVAQEVLKTPGLQSGLQALCAAAVAKAMGRSIEDVITGA